MNRDMDIQKAKLLGYGLSGIFLVIHVMLFLLFRRYGVKPMMYFNVFSILFYISSPLLLKKDWLWLYVVSVYLEILAHMTLAVIFVGPESGFQVTLIGLIILLFYSEYLSTSLNRRHVPGVALGLLGMALYLGGYLYTRRFPPLYAFPEDVSFKLQLVWGVIVFVVDIFFLKVFVVLASNSELSLSERALHDPLTGLYNRAGYEKNLAGMDEDDIALLLIDADYFKNVNDNYGHEVGDRILKKIAEALRCNFRADDCICRIGGDEFAVLMRSPEGLSQEQIAAKVKHINALLADTSDGLPQVSVSVGAAHGGNVADLDGLFESADSALYQRKREGRGGCTFYQRASV